MKPPFGTGLLSSTAIGVCIAEMSRIDLGVGTFWLLLLGLVYYTLDAFCSPE